MQSRVGWSNSCRYLNWTSRHKNTWATKLIKHSLFLSKTVKLNSNLNIILKKLSLIIYSLYLLSHSTLLSRLFSYVCLKASWPFNKRNIDLFLNWLNSTNIPTRSLIKKRPVFMASVGMEKAEMSKETKLCSVLPLPRLWLQKNAELKYHITLTCHDL